MALFFALITVSLALLMPGTARAGEARFGAWAVKCAGEICSATAKAGRAGMSISRSTGPLERDGGEGALWAVSIDMPVVEGNPRASLRIGSDAILHLENGYGLKQFGPEGRYFLADERALATILQHVTAVPQMTISFNERYEIADNQEGVEWHELRVTGLSEALDHIDEIQKMAGALRIADMPRWLKLTQNAVAAPELPDQVKLAHFNSGGCNPVRHEAPSQVTAFEAHGLGETEILYLIECNLYAYNWDVRGYIAQFQDGQVTGVETVSVPVITEAGWSATTLIPAGSFDPDTGRLFGFHKGRGLGDCGGSQTWRHTGYRGFILVESRYRACDREVPSEGDEIADWPVVYRLGLDDVSQLNRPGQK